MAMQHCIVAPSCDAITIIYNVCNHNSHLYAVPKGLFKVWGGGGGGGGRREGSIRGFKPPPPEIFRFFLKNKGKEVERKIEKK